MREHLFQAITKVFITWLLFSAVFFFAMQSSSGRELLELAVGEASESPVRRLLPAAALLIAMIWVVGSVLRQATKPEHWKELIGEVMDALGSGLATIAAGMFFVGVIAHGEWLGMIVAGLLAVSCLFVSKQLGA